MSLQIGKAIYHLLSKDSRIKEKVGSKIYPLIVEESTTFPFIIYKRTNISPNYTKGSYSVNESVTVDVVIASKDYTDTVELADRRYIHSKYNIRHKHKWQTKYLEGMT